MKRLDTFCGIAAAKFNDPGHPLSFINNEGIGQFFTSSFMCE
jgi:hypothetical protein